MGSPLFEILSNVGFKTSQASQCGEEWFAVRRSVEHQLEIVRRIHGDGAVLELGDIERPVQSTVS